MKPEYQNILDLLKSNKNKLNRAIKKVKRLRKGDADRLIHTAHNHAFEHIDCLLCANCCTTTGPLLTEKDIARLAKHLGRSESAFVKTYLRTDEDHDYVFQSLPCPFLGADNYCEVYEARPKACREYPHTDRSNQLGILSITKKNALICPAVAEIINDISK